MNRTSGKNYTVACMWKATLYDSIHIPSRVYSQKLEPSRGIEKGSSYFEFRQEVQVTEGSSFGELTGVRNTF